MRYKIFGRRTGLRVAELALGTGNFGTGWGHGAEPGEARRMFDRYAEAGGNFLDSADTYQFGQSETLLGEFIAAERDHFVVASKYSLGASPDGGVSRTGNSRKNMIRSVEESLKRLKTDRIDLYWVHIPDGVTPLEEIARGFDDLVRAGKILYAGLSDFPAWRVARAATLADLRGWAPLAGVQFEYSLVERTPDRELLPMAEALGLGTTLWSPLGGGFLTGKYRRAEEGRLTRLGMLIHSETTQRNTAILDAVQTVAGVAGATPTAVAIAWLRHKAAASPTAIIPILGPRTHAQLDDTLTALGLTLSDDQLRLLDEASAVPLGFPHDFLAQDRNRNRIAGGTADLIDIERAPAA
jgi:aryl-alcohol dehydrogenase-like predicted oxidoreductase